MRSESVLGLIGGTPLVGIHALSPNPAVRIFAKLEGQNPGGSSKDRIALKMVELAARRRAPRRRHDPRAVVGEHWHRARTRCEAPGLQAPCRHAGERVARASSAARDLRRRHRGLAGRGGQQRRDPPGGEARGRRPEPQALVPVREPGQPARALRRDGARDLGRLPRSRRVRRRARDERDADGRRPLPQGAAARCADRRGRAAGGGAGARFALAR